MKRVYVSILTFLTAVFCAFAFTGCQKQVTVDGDHVVIVAEDVAADTTLVSYMEALREDGKLTFTIADGMVTSIDGKENADGCFWMLYTSDDEFSSEAWGTIDYGGATYKSASVGASEIVVAESETYIWVYTGI